MLNIKYKRTAYGPDEYANIIQMKTDSKGQRVAVITICPETGRDQRIVRVSEVDSMELFHGSIPLETMRNS